MSDGIDVTHVSDGWSYNFILVFDVVVELFIGGVGSGYEVIFVEIGVVWSGCMRRCLPNPLKEYCVFWSRFCNLRVAACIKLY